MVNLNASIPVSNITKYQIISYDAATGAGVMQIFMGSGQTQSFFLPFKLSDVAGKSTGIAVNAAPSSNHDLMRSQDGMGLSNAFASAYTAFKGGANQGASLKAVELRGVTDGWLDPLLAGT